MFAFAASVAVVCATLLVASASALDAAAPAQPRMTLFVEGLATGLTVDIGNVTECTASIHLSLEHFDAALPRVSEGLATDNIQLVRSAVPVLGQGFEQIAHAFTVCGLFRVSEQVELIAKSMKDEATSEFYTSTLLSATAKDDVASAVKYFTLGDYFSAGVYTGRTLGVLVEKSFGSSGDVIKRQYFA